MPPTTLMKSTYLFSAGNKMAVLKAYTCCTTRCILFLAFIFSGLSHLRAQQAYSNEIKHIDSLIKVVHRYYLDGKENEAFIITQKKVIPQSRKIMYQKGLCKGNYYLACCLFYAEKYKESIQYIKKSQSYNSYLKSDPLQRAKNYWLIANNLNSLQLYTLASKNYHKSIDIVNSIKSKSANNLLFQSSVYASLNDIHINTGVHDSIYYYLQKQHSILKKLPPAFSYIQLGDYYTGLGNYYFLKNKIDSSDYCFKKAVSILKNRHYSEINVLIGLGNIYSHKGNEDEAIKYFSEAINKSRQYHYYQLQGNIYQGLKNSYYNKSDFGKFKMYSDLQKKFQDSSSLSRSNNRSSIIKEIMKDEEEEEKQQKKEENRKHLIWGGIFAITVISSLWGVYILRKREKEFTLRLTKKRELIDEKVKYTNELEQKLKITLEEVMDEAKKNSPSFFEKFQLLYPHFRGTLLGINENLTSGELVLLAYVYLNLSSKEIADYTFRSYRTVQTRKYTLRKKLGLETNQDLYVWLKSIC